MPKRKKIDTEIPEVTNTNEVPRAEPMPVPSPIVDRKADALRRLKVKDEQLETAPKITELLKDIAGGLSTALEAMRFGDNDEVIASFLKKYDSVSAYDRESLAGSAWEAIALSAGVNLKYLAGSVMIATANYCANQSRIIVATNHPEVTRKRVEYAKMASGEKDRYALDLMAGAIQPSKGPTFIAKAVFGGDGGTKKSEDKDEDGDQPAMFGVDDDLDGLFPSVSETQNKLVPIRQRLLDK